MKNDKLVKAFNGITLVLVCLSEMVITGLTLTALWNWFIVPFGVMKINIFHGVGLSLFTFIFNLWSKKISTSNDFEERLSIICAAIIIKIFIIGIAAILQLLI